MGSYFSVIRAIVAGNSMLSAIASVLETKATSLTKYLKSLIGLDILEREVPVTEENPEKSKRGLYRIKDNYIRFWFAFVYPNRSFIESGHSGIVLNKIRNSLVKNHTAFVYEDVCRERMWELNTEGNNLILGECKYWQEPVGVIVLRNLEEKAETVSWKREDLLLFDDLEKD